MTFRKLQNMVCVGVFWALGVSAMANGQAKTGSLADLGQIRALPLYEQCAALQSNNAAVPAALAELKDKDPQKRSQAANALAKSCDTRATEALLAALKDEEVSVRVAVVSALGQLGDRSAIEPLIEATSDDSWQVRAALARTLASFQVYASNNATLNALANPGEKKITEEGDLRARCLAILAVNQLRDVRFSRKAIGFAFVFQELPEQKLRSIVTETLLALRNTRNGYHELAGILKQSNFPDFRRKAAYWLGKFETDAARTVLAEVAAADRDATVQRAAQEALAAMKPQ